MPVPDDVLLTAMADASGGSTVLLITNDEAETTAAVAQAVRLLIDALTEYAGASRIAAQRFVGSADGWLIKLKSGGWISFCPSADLSGGGLSAGQLEELGQAPRFVFVRDGMTYVRMGYSFWRSKLPTIPPPPEPGETPESEDTMRSAWNRLMDDED